MEQQHQQEERGHVSLPTATPPANEKAVRRLPPMSPGEAKALIASLQREVKWRRRSKHIHLGIMLALLASAYLIYIGHWIATGEWGDFPYTFITLGNFVNLVGFALGQPGSFGWRYTTTNAVTELEDVRSVGPLIEVFDYNPDFAQTRL